VQNFRGVRRASWAPEGVCALVGPNASGKSTLLEAFLFVHNAARRSPKDAILISGGMQAFVTHDPVLDGPGDDPALAQVRFTVEVPQGTWKLAFSATSDNRAATYEEDLDDRHQSGVLLDVPTLLFAQIGLTEPPALLHRLYDIVLYRPWEIQQLRRQPFSDPTLDDVLLAPDGANVFPVPGTPMKSGLMPLKRRRTKPIGRSARPFSLPLRTLQATTAKPPRARAYSRNLGLNTVASAVCERTTVFMLSKMSAAVLPSKNFRQRSIHRKKVPMDWLSVSSI
jgi:AAA domain, putative AbiEii toxin, Type IV TA system